MSRRVETLARTLSPGSLALQALGVAFRASQRR
jgi:hypothetical protein